MDKVNRVMLVSLVTNVLLAIFKIIFGFVGSSGALIADGVHSFSDMITDIFASVGNVISKKPADHEHPFGHGNAEYLTCLVIGSVIGIMGVEIILDGITRESNIPSIYVATVSFVTIMAKLLLAKFVLNSGKKYQSSILISSGKESMTDVISSLVVLLSVLLSRLSNFNSLFSYSDKFAMILVGIFILRIAYEIIRENASNLLGRQVTDDEYINMVEDVINDYDEIIKIDSLIILKFGSFKKIDCEVSMDENLKLKDVHSVVDYIEDKLKDLDETISNVIIHVNPSNF